MGHIALQIHIMCVTQTLIRRHTRASIWAGQWVRGIQTKTHWNVAFGTNIIFWACAVVWGEAWTMETADGTHISCYPKTYRCLTLRMNKPFGAIALIGRNARAVLRASFGVVREKSVTKWILTIFTSKSSGTHAILILNTVALSAAYGTRIGENTIAMGHIALQIHIMCVTQTLIRRHTRASIWAGQWVRGIQTKTHWNVAFGTNKIWRAGAVVRRWACSISWAHMAFVGCNAKAIPQLTNRANKPERTIAIVWSDTCSTWWACGALIGENSKTFWKFTIQSSIHRVAIAHIRTGADSIWGTRLRVIAHKPKASDEFAWISWIPGVAVTIVFCHTRSMAFAYIGSVCWLETEANGNLAFTTSVSRIARAIMRSSACSLWGAHFSRIGKHTKAINVGTLCSVEISGAITLVVCVTCSVRAAHQTVIGKDWKAFVQLATGTMMIQITVALIHLDTRPMCAAHRGIRG